ncbi:MAG: chromosomal replication initiator DnaA [Caulobacterales bacterium]|nr:chromosomal replication initiator DnaA [Caulobacterales bacterium]
MAQQAVAFVFGLPVEEIAAATRRSKSAALARQSAMYLTHIAFGLNFARVADAFGRDRTTVAHACQVIEERRDDPEFDTCIENLESFLRAAPARTREIAA